MIAESIQIGGGLTGLLVLLLVVLVIVAIARRL